MVHSLIGPRIRERRRARKISQVALARDVGISASYLNLIEHNKRGIAGRTLNSIARELDMAPAELSEGADAGLIDTLTEAAGAAPSAGAEMDRIGELIGRFPGWARVVGALAQRSEAQDRQLTLLSDRLAHDPYLAEAMHLMLSSVTAVHSTAGILSENADMATDQRSRFTGNLYDESVRLTETAKDLVAYFDNPQERGVGGEEAADLLHDFWANRNFYLGELEHDPTAYAALLSELDGIPREDAVRSITRYAKVASALPLAAFSDEARRQKWDPLALAQSTGAALSDVFFRLAHMPQENDPKKNGPQKNAPREKGTPVFGLIECDASGGVLFRKELPGFPLPRLGGACPLWPLYRALSQPGQPTRGVLRTPGDETFVAWAISAPDGPTAYGLPPTCRSAMLFTAEASLVPTDGVAPQIDVGAQCRICPRKTCASRRAAFLLL